MPSIWGKGVNVLHACISAKLSQAESNRFLTRDAPSTTLLSQRCPSVTLSLCGTIITTMVIEAGVTSKVITRIISTHSSLFRLFRAPRSAIYLKGNISQFRMEQRWGWLLQQKNCIISEKGQQKNTTAVDH